ncbi:MAG: cobalt transporter CbiM [Lachnospiraceae bacterium]|nr:cobalt transporter CbiM [Lachnospiraceae bacterium]
MHIPENYLSPSTCAVLGAAMVPVWGRCIQKVKLEVPKEKLPILGIGAAFSFLGMMFNLPLPGGTTGHAVGGTLIALLLGPHAACLAVSVALIVQALLFGDGGVLAIGANCFNMAFILPFVGYGVFGLISKAIKGNKGDITGAIVGSYLGINAAALAAAIEFGIQPIFFKDAAGQALYCPYGLNISIPAMMIGHLTLFGLAEVIFTVAIYAFVKQTSPGVIEDSKKMNLNPIRILIVALVALTPLGLLATGTAWGEWGADEIAEVTSSGTALGYTPKGLLEGFSLETIFPDYVVNGMPEWAGYILSAVIGVAIAVIVFRLVAAVAKKKKDSTGTV